MNKLSEDKLKSFIEILCKWLELEFEYEWGLINNLLVNYPRYIPERIFDFIRNKIQNSQFEISFGDVNPELLKVEKIVLDNYLFGDLEIVDKIVVSVDGIYSKNDSLIYKLLNGEVDMRVNVLQPKLLSDQHLIAEYREVKMGPKALSKSLFSKGGVDKKRISPVYILNTGHTYFFYDKNKYLEGRLARIVKEMAERGIEHNFVDLIDDKYDYHPSTFNDEWWNDWIPDVNALNVNMERINQRFSIKPDGWYRFWGRPIYDMEDLINTRLENSFYECPKCRAILTKNIYTEALPICWCCCSKLPNNLELRCYC